MSDQKEERAVLPAKGKGPHGLGDPDDRTLRRVELEIKIPQIMRDRAKTEKCAQEFKDFGDCCIEAQYLMTFKCRPQNKKLMECMERWYTDDGFKQECTEIYLNQRKQFRLTGKKAPPKRKEVTF